MNTGNPFYQKPRISSRFFPGLLSCRKLQIRGQIKSALKRETGDWIITRANYWSLALWVTLYFFSAACSLRSRLDTEPHEAWRKALGEVETSTSGNEQKRSSIIMAGRVFFNCTQIMVFLKLRVQWQSMLAMTPFLIYDSVRRREWNP